MGKSVALIQGGLSSERDVSLTTGAAFESALKELGYTYQVIDAQEDLPKILFDKKNEIDVALLALHGKLAEDGVVQGICEYLKIPYTGSGVLGSALGFDKYYSKKVLKFHGLPTADFELVSLEKVALENFKSHVGFPCAVKPSRDGSSMGVTICETAENWKEALNIAAQFDSEILVEEYLEGAELTVPILIDRALTPIEIRPKSEFYNYKNKYTAGQTEYILPPPFLSGKDIDNLKCLALEAHKALRARVYSRVDFKMKGDQPVILEINTLPGCTPTSLVPKSAAYEGIRFPEFIQTLVENAGLDYHGVS